MRFVTAAVAALVLAGCALAQPLTDADKAALDGIWMLAEDDPLASGDQARFYASYAMTLNLSLGGGYFSEGVSPRYSWSRIASSDIEGDTVTLTIPGDAEGAGFTMTRREADMVTLTRAGKTMSFQRVRPGEPLANDGVFEALALRLQQTSDAPARFVALVSPEEDPALACGDDARQTVEIDLLSPFAHTLFVKKNIDLAGYAMSDIDIDKDGGHVTFSAREMQADARPAESWTISGIDGKGPITITPMTTTFADCTGGLQ